MNWFFMFVIIVLVLMLVALFIAYINKNEELERLKKVRYFTAVRTIAKAHPETDTTEVQFQFGAYKFQGLGYYSEESTGKYDFKSQ